MIIADDWSALMGVQQKSRVSKREVCHAPVLTILVYFNPKN